MEASRISQVLPRLFIMSQQVFLANVCKFTHEVQVMEEPHAPETGKSHFIPAKDVPGQDLRQYFDESNQFIGETLLSGGKVAVYCFAGVSRSATIVLAFLMHRCRWTLEAALDHLAAIRPIISPNLGFISQLVKYEMDLRSAGHYSRESRHPVALPPPTTCRYMVGRVKGVECVMYHNVHLDVKAVRQVVLKDAQGNVIAQCDYSEKLSSRVMSGHALNEEVCRHWVVQRMCRRAGIPRDAAKSVAWSFRVEEDHRSCI